MATPKVFASDYRLSFAVPNKCKCLQDSEEMIEVMTSDEAFSVVAMPFDMESTPTESLSQLIADLAEEAEIDLNECNELTIENDDIFGSVYAITVDDVIYVFGLCGDDEIGFAFQITATTDYEDEVMAVLQTLSIEEE